MLHWSCSPLRFRRPLVLIASAVCCLAPCAKAPTPSAKHGLTGSYYIGAGQWDKDTPPTATFSVVQIWSDANDFNLPRTFTAPAATRVDAQVAFGEGKGFHAKEGGPAMTWWPTGFPDPLGWKPVGPTDKPWDNLATVIWKGYIHLPKAGTYYFGTISNGPSAVYLNQARVALNGFFGGVLVSDAFSYAKEDRQELVQNLFSGREDVALGSRPRDTYVVPVSIDAPRDLPIEVQYNPTQHFSHLANEPFGIDLFWVTPDSPHDANGKPIAKIVPIEVLYTEPPSAIEKPTVRSANSTIEADRLYFPTEYVGESVTVTIRLADKEGSPVAGKRVYVSSLTSYGNSDAITQPDKPTDKNGETKAKIRANAAYAVGHDSAIFATDVTDLVDVAQVAHVTFQQVDWNFFTDAFSPYYDRRFSVTPRPPVVGQPATLKTELKNHSKFPATVTVTFLTTDWNIGFTNFEEIARAKDIALQPGESKVVSRTFTPKEVMSHKCYRVEVEGRYVAMNSSGEKVLAASLLSLANPEVAAPQKPLQQPPRGSQQINTQTISPCFPFNKCVPDKQDWMNYWLGVEQRAKTVVGLCSSIPKTGAGHKLGTLLGSAIALKLVGKGVSIGTTVSLLALCSWIEADEYGAHWLASDPPDPNFREVYTPYDYQLPPPARSDSVPAPYAAALDAAMRNQLEIVSLETAVLVSLERYQGATAAGDQDAARRHFIAYTNYTNQVAQRFERGATLLEDLVAAGRTSGVPDIIITADQIRAAQQQLTSEGLADQLLAAFAFLGNSEKFRSISEKLLHEDILPAAQRVDPNTVAGSIYEMLLAKAAFYRRAAPGLRRKAQATYMVGNPHDKEQTIDLFIRPISIPPDWKLSVVNAEQATGQLRPGDPPTVLVREIEAGKHYAVTLPAKAQVQVASVLVPAGEVGEHTTVRWAVEGKIADELVGGMVHEMSVPDGIPDLERTPVGANLPNSWRRIAAEIAAAVVLLGLLAYFFIFWRRRRRSGTPSAV